MLMTALFHTRQSAHLRHLAMRMKPGAKRRRVLQFAFINDRLARLQNQSSQQMNDIQAPKPFTESTAAGEQSGTLPAPRSEVFAMDPLQLTIDSLSERMAELLSQSENPQQEMAVVENLLERDGFLVSPRRKSPAMFSRDVFEGARSLVRAAEQLHYDPASAESAEDMVLRLLPSDGHPD